MRYRRFGTSDLEVSEVGFGIWTLASDWWGVVEDKQGLLHAALDAGINFIDTAPVYGDDGFGETLLADVLKAQPRRDRPHDQVRLRHRRGAQVPRPVGAPARLGPGVDPAPARRLAAAARHRLHRPLPAAQHPHRADPRRRAVGGARRSSAPRARSASSASRSVPRSVGSTKGSRRSATATSCRCRRCSTCSSRSPACTFAARAGGRRRHASGSSRACRTRPTRCRARSPATRCSRPRTTARTATATTCSTTSTRPRRSRSSGRAPAAPIGQAAIAGILANPAFTTVLPDVRERRRRPRVRGRGRPARSRRRGRATSTSSGATTSASRTATRCR